MQKTSRSGAFWAVACAVACALVAAPVHAQWKWRDKDGRITISDRPPPMDIPESDILDRPEPHHPAAAEPPASAASVALVPARLKPTPLQLEIEARRHKAEEERAAKIKAAEQRVAAQRAENCLRARAQEVALQSGQRLARVGPNGERIVLDDQGRAQELRAVRKVIEADCR
jgi:hypothetical protein